MNKNVPNIINTDDVLTGVTCLKALECIAQNPVTHVQLLFVVTNPSQWELEVVFRELGVPGKRGRAKQIPALSQGIPLSSLT